MAKKDVIVENQDFGPICVIEDQKELDALLAWWQEKLFLQDWIINASVVSSKEFDLEDSAGENLMCVEQKMSTIHLLDASEAVKDSPVRFCHEKILVHELLHCLYDLLDPAENSYTEKYLEMMDHARLEQMAKSLMMVKYGLSFDWFKNPDKVIA